MFDHPQRQRSNRTPTPDHSPPFSKIDKAYPDDEMSTTKDSILREWIHNQKSLENGEVKTWQRIDNQRKFVSNNEDPAVREWHFEQKRDPDIRKWIKEEKKLLKQGKSTEQRQQAGGSDKDQQRASLPYNNGTNSGERPRHPEQVAYLPSSQEGRTRLPSSKEELVGWLSSKEGRTHLLRSQEGLALLFYSQEGQNLKFAERQRLEIAQHLSVASYENIVSLLPSPRDQTDQTGENSSSSREGQARERNGGAEVSRNLRGMRTEIFELLRDTYRQKTTLLQHKEDVNRLRTTINQIMFKEISQTLYEFTAKKLQEKLIKMAGLDFRGSRNRENLSAAQKNGQGIISNLVSIAFKVMGYGDIDRKMTPQASQEFNKMVMNATLEMHEQAGFVLNKEQKSKIKLYNEHEKKEGSPYFSRLNVRENLRDNPIEGQEHNIPELFEKIFPEKNIIYAELSKKTPKKQEWSLIDKYISFSGSFSAEIIPLRDDVKLITKGPDHIGGNVITNNIEYEATRGNDTEVMLLQHISKYLEKHKDERAEYELVIHSQLKPCYSCSQSMLYFIKKIGERNNNYSLKIYMAHEGNYPGAQKRRQKNG